jgi:hypothetical protein
MPDKNDPKYKERYEKDVAAGRRFASLLRIDRAAARVQRFAEARPRLFFTLVAAFLLAASSLNVYRIRQACQARRTHPTTVYPTIKRNAYERIVQETPQDSL